MVRFHRICMRPSKISTVFQGAPVYEGPEALRLQFWVKILDFWCKIWFSYAMLWVYWRKPTSKQTMLKVSHAVLPPPSREGLQRRNWQRTPWPWPGPVWFFETSVDLFALVFACVTWDFIGFPDPAVLYSWFSWQWCWFFKFWLDFDGWNQKVDRKPSGSI